MLANVYPQHMVNKKSLVKRANTVPSGRHNCIVKARFEPIDSLAITLYSQHLLHKKLKQKKLSISTRTA